MPPAACTNACTSERENANAGPLGTDQGQQPEVGRRLGATGARDYCRF